MDNNEDPTRGDPPQVPPAKPPDRCVGQQNPANGAQEICVINEAMSEDEAPMYAALEEQPTAMKNVENGVSLPVTTSNVPVGTGGDHVGTADGGPEVIAREHVGTGNRTPREVASRQTTTGEDHVGTAHGGPEVIAQNHTGTANHGPGEDDPLPPYPGQEPGRPQNPRNSDKQAVKLAKGHFDRRMGELINGIKDLAEDQHRDNLKLEANVGINQQIAQDTMQFMTESNDSIKNSHKNLHENMVKLGNRIVSIESATENAANAAREMSGNALTLITALTEEVRKQGHSLADLTGVIAKLEGLLMENQSPMIRQDAKRKRVRAQSITPEMIDLEEENNVQIPEQPAAPAAPPPQETTSRDAIMVPQGTVIQNGSLATTVMGPNGRPILRRPAPPTSSQSAGNPTSVPPRLPVRQMRDGNLISTYTANDGSETLRLPRPAERGQNLNPNGNGTRPRQNTYATAAATPAAPPAAPAPTIPGLNHDSQRAHHTQNNRGVNRGPRETNSNNDRQPTRVRDDHFTICPVTGNVQRVEAYKTVPFRSEKQKGIANKRHIKNLAQVMCELILFGIPTRNKNGEVMTSLQDRLRISKFLRELRIVGYEPRNGDVVGNVRQWRNPRHPDHIPITITFCDEATRLRVEEAALELGVKGHRVPREGDEQYDRIGYIRRSMTERERKELKIRNEKRNSPAGMAFAEIKKREEESRADQADWADFNLEGDDYPEIDPPIMEQAEPAANRTENNNNNTGGAMSAEDMMLKMQEQQRQIEALQAEKDRAAAEAARARESTRQTEEAVDSDFELLDPISHGMTAHRSSQSREPPRANLNIFSQEPMFNYTGNLNLSRPNLSRQEESTPTNSSVLRGNDSSDSECEASWA